VKKFALRAKKVQNYFDLSAIIVIIKLIINRKIITIMKEATVQKPATRPQTMKSQMIVTMKNRFQLRRSDCLVDFFL